MRYGKGGRLAGALVVLLVLSLVGTLPGARAALDPAPSLRLFAIDYDLAILRRNRRVELTQLGIWAASVGGAFELRVWRDNYRSSVEIAQFDAETRAMIRPLPSDTLAGWTGLDDFLRIGIWDAQGVKRVSSLWDFCPNQYEQERVNDEGPETPSYPSVCTGNPLTKGTVWGLDDGWAVRAVGWFDHPGSFRLDDGRYTVRIAIARRYVELFDVAPGDRSVTIDLTLTQGTNAPRSSGSDDAQDGSSAGAVPENTDPDPSTMPDLRPLPPWDFRVHHRRGRDYLSFAATEWNAGPSPLVVEGFRREGEALMDAYQYFYPGPEGPPVARAPVGTLEFHEGRGHHHWHFEEFTEYSLLDATQSKAAVSGKQSWCLVPTDPIDLTMPGANWTPWSVGLGSACGGRDSIWVREHLDAGWGDTYYQYASGQAFDITDLPNGRYFVKVHVNPTGSLYERSTANNVRLRRVRLLGRPGARRVVVPLWNGIDTEGGYEEGFD